MTRTTGALIPTYQYAAFSSKSKRVFGDFEEFVFQVVGGVWERNFGKFSTVTTDLQAASGTAGIGEIHWAHARTQFGVVRMVAASAGAVLEPVSTCIP
jgi:hypothetical protein